MKSVLVPTDLLKDMVYAPEYPDACPAATSDAMLELAYMLNCDPGYWTERRMCERWKWSRGKVQRLIAKYKAAVEGE